MRKKTLTLHGPAAAELLRAQHGYKAHDDNERALRIATIVHMHMSNPDDMRLAVALIKCVAKEGLERGAEVCTARRSDGGVGA